MTAAMPATWPPPTQALVIFTGHLLDARLQVVVAGEVDLATAEELRGTLLATISRTRVAETMLVDLADVRFLDARGVAVLIESSVAAHRMGVRFMVRNPRGIVRRVLEAAGAAPMLGLAPVKKRSAAGQAAKSAVGVARTG